MPNIDMALYGLGKETTPVLGNVHRKPKQGLLFNPENVAIMTRFEESKLIIELECPCPEEGQSQLRFAIIDCLQQLHVNKKLLPDDQQEQLAKWWLLQLLKEIC